MTTAPSIKPEELKQMSRPNSVRRSRRRFLKSAAAAAAVTVAAPAVITQAKGDCTTLLGNDDHRFEVQHAFPQLPAKYSWQTTHNVAVDKAGNLYVIHEGRRELKDHPSIFVFSPDGTFIRAFGSQFQGGGHGLEVHQEGGEEFLYVCAYQHLKTLAKLTLKGETVWQKFAPMKSGVYAEGEDTTPEKIWGRNRFLPTNFAFLPDGDVLLVDGYGAYCVHRYDTNGNWKSHFGAPGQGKGTFNLPHGIWVDSRGTREPTLIVCDRAHHKVQILSLDGKHLSTLDGFGLPANADTWNDLVVIPELHARVTLLDAENKVAAQLGDDVKRVTTQQGIRTDPSSWIDGKFVHPHDACFAADGSIFVAEWVGSGRISRLKRL
jgi:hypothetical protein